MCGFIEATKCCPIETTNSETPWPPPGLEEAYARYQAESRRPASAPSRRPPTSTVPGGGGNTSHTLPPNKWDKIAEDGQAEWLYERTRHEHTMPH